MHIEDRLVDTAYKCQKHIVWLAWSQQIRKHVKRNLDHSPEDKMVESVVFQAAGAGFESRRGYKNIFETK